jgi:hypothetical protein
VHIPDGKKDADAMAHHRVQHLVHDFNDAAIRGRKDNAGGGGNHALRIAEKIKNEEAEANQNDGRNFPAGNEAQCARDERRQGESVRVFNHGPRAKSFVREKMRRARAPWRDRSRVKSTANAPVLYDRSERAVRALAVKNLVMDHFMIMAVTRHNHFHQVFQAQLHFLQTDFQFQVFHVPVGLTDEFFQLRFTAGVFFEEPAVFLVRFQQGLPDIMRRDRHPFPPGVQRCSHRRNNYHNRGVDANRQERRRDGKARPQAA